MNREEAISPVVAVMLILAVVITFFAVFNATVVPAMKERAEIEHLERVKEAFGRFDSDVRLALAIGRGISLKERIQLGGGDVLLNTVRSGGTLRVQELAPPLLRIAIDNSTHSAGMVQVSYQPVSNFWQDQGYTWQWGYLNVTKGGGSASTPLEYPRMEEVPLEGFASSLASIARGADGSCTLRYANFVAGNSDFASGNGDAVLRLDASAVEGGTANAWVNLTITGDAGAPGAFGEILPILEGQCTGCSNILSCTYDADAEELRIQTTGIAVVEHRIAIHAE